MQKYELYNDYKISFETPNDGYSYFFGYYDKSPLNRANNKLLAHRINFDGREVRDGDIADVGYFDLQTNVFIKIDETLAWNWQQGAQLQWLPPDFDEEIIYNSTKNNKFVSIVFNIRTREKRVIPFPVYAVHPNGREALGVNYERHYWCRPGYNYQNIRNKKWDQPYHNEDGIYRIDLETGKVKLIISITKIINHEKLPEFEVCDNWLEHIMYNPSGDRFMFFHRWQKNGVDVSRVYTANSENGRELFMLPDNRFYSHYFWKTDAELTIWSADQSHYSNAKLINNIAKNNKFLNKVLRPIYRTIRACLPGRIKKKLRFTSKLLTFKDKDGAYKIVGDNILVGNGHQSWFDNNKKLLTDSYQDEKKYRYLMIYDAAVNQTRKVGKFYSHYNDCVYRCDLHPRINHNNNYIVIDSAHNKKRNIMIIEGQDAVD